MELQYKCIPKNILHRIRAEQAILYVSSQNGSFLMDGLVGGSVLRPTSRNLEMIISVYGYLRLSRSLFDFTLETIMVWMIWTAITDDSLACNVLNARTDVRIDMSFPALVGIDGVTISALIGHLINSSTPLNTAQHSSTQNTIMLYERVCSDRSFFV